MKRKIIKLTERQLKETQGDAFAFLDGNDTPAYNGQSEISVTGLVDDEEFGYPTTGDEIADDFIPQTAFRLNAMYGYGGYGRLREDTAQPMPTPQEHGENEDKDGDHVNDFYTNKTLDTLSNGDNNDNLAKVPEGAQTRLNALIQTMNSEKLNLRQVAMILNKFLESYEWDKLPYSWKKALRLKIS